MAEKRARFQLVAQPVKRLPQPWNDAPWPCGQGPRYWTPERIAELQQKNEAYRQAKKQRL